MSPVEKILDLDPCPEARAWLADQQPDLSIAEGVALCPRGEWLLWLAAKLGLQIPEAAYRPAVVRAMRYAASALRTAGFSAEAEALSGIPADAPFQTMRAVAWSAANVVRGEAAWAAARGEEAWTAVRAVALVASAAARAEAWTAEAAGWAALAMAEAEAEAGAVEHSLCADDVRSAIGVELIAALSAPH